MKYLEKEYIAIYALGISVILAVIKIYELWRDRRRVILILGPAATNGGVNIYVINNSSRHTFIRDWSFVYGDLKILSFFLYQRRPGYEIDIDVFEELPPKKRVLIYPCTDQYDFNWKDNHRPNARLFLKLYMEDDILPIILKVG